MRILFCINSIGRVSGIESVTILKANHLAELLKNNKWGGVAICYSDKCNFPETVIPLSPLAVTYDTKLDFYGNTMRNLPKFLVRFVSKLFRHRKRIQAVIDDFRPDIIVSTGQAEKFVFPFLRNSDKKKKLVKIREIHFNSNYRYFRYSKWLAALVNFVDYRVFSRAFDKVYLLTAQDKRENFPANTRFTYMPNPISFGIDKDETPVTARQKSVLAVGRLVPQKNFASLLRIWAAVGKKHPDWKLRIVGDGAEMQRLQQLADEIRITESTEFAGHSGKVHDEMRKAQIFAMTSLYEGFGMVLIEAAACGLPAVSYKTPYGPEELISDGKTGLLAEYLDEKGFADKLDFLIQNDSLRRRMGAEARKDVSRYAADTIIRRWMREYEALLSEK